MALTACRSWQTAAAGIWLGVVGQAQDVVGGGVEEEREAGQNVQRHVARRRFHSGGSWVWTGLAFSPALLA